MEDFSVHISGDEIPDESILLERLKEALRRGTTRVNIINGYVVDTNSSVNLTVGPFWEKSQQTVQLLCLRSLEKQI